MSKSVVYRHYLRALSRWPKDPLRPETQFQDFIRRRVDRTFGVAPAAPSSAAATPQSALEKPLDEARELEQVNALYSLLEGRYAQKYPIQGNLMKPTKNPTYYSDLVRELEEAPNRSWFGRMTNRWKGLFRWK